MPGYEGTRNSPVTFTNLTPSLFPIREEESPLSVSEMGIGGEVIFGRIPHAQLH